MTTDDADPELRLAVDLHILARRLSAAGQGAEAFEASREAIELFVPRFLAGSIDKMVMAAVLAQYRKGAEAANQPLDTGLGLARAVERLLGDFAAEALPEEQLQDVTRLSLVVAEACRAAGKLREAHSILAALDGLVRANPEHEAPRVLYAVAASLLVKSMVDAGRLDDASGVMRELLAFAEATPTHPTIASECGWAVETVVDAHLERGNLATAQEFARAGQWALQSTPYRAALAEAIGEQSSVEFLAWIDAFVAER